MWKFLNGIWTSAKEPFTTRKRRREIGDCDTSQELLHTKRTKLNDNPSSSSELKPVPRRILSSFNFLLPSWCEHWVRQGRTQRIMDIRRFNEQGDEDLNLINNSTGVNGQHSLSVPSYGHSNNTNGDDGDDDSSVVIVDEIIADPQTSGNQMLNHTVLSDMDVINIETLDERNPQSPRQRGWERFSSAFDDISMQNENFHQHRRPTNTSKTNDSTASWLNVSSMNSTSRRSALADYPVLQTGINLEERERYARLLSREFMTNVPSLPRDGFTRRDHSARISTMSSPSSMFNRRNKEYDYRKHHRQALASLESVLGLDTTTEKQEPREDSSLGYDSVFLADKSTSAAASEPSSRRPSTTPRSVADVMGSTSVLNEKFRQIDPDLLVSEIKASVSARENREEQIKAVRVEEKLRAEARALRNKKRDEEMRLTLRLEELLIEEPELVEAVELIPLTSEQEAVVKNALARGRPDEVLVNAFAIEIKRHDIQTLSGSNWLNDEVINFYMNLLMDRGGKNGRPKVYVTSTFFYPKLLQGGHSSLKRWTRKVDIFSYDMIFVPVHLGAHWCLAVVDFRKKIVQYFDSMGGTNDKCMESLLKYLEAESLDKKSQKYNTSDWKMINVKNAPQQLNGCDCGMFACKYAEYLSRNAPITFKQENMPYFRRRMVYEIIKKTLL